MIPGTSRTARPTEHRSFPVSAASLAPLLHLYRILYAYAVKTLPLTEARKELPNIVDEVSGTQEHVVITKRGRPEAVVMSIDEFESWRETVEIVSDPEAMAGIRQGLRDVKAGRVRSLDEVLRRLGI